MSSRNARPDHTFGPRTDLAYLEPHLDWNDAAVDNVFFDFRAAGEETAVRFLGGEAHHVFDAGAIVPAAIEYDDLARGGKAFDVALNEDLAFFAVRQGDGGGFCPSFNR
jgi:hypothetical protein